LLDEHDRLVLLDPGLSLRVPYVDPCNYGGVMDASAGTCRRLIKAQGLGGKLLYAAPEVIQNEVAYDGFAIDLWSAGVVLFVMLVGLTPFKWAHPSDQRYNAISQGGLAKTIASLDIPLNKEACHLLQGMFHSDPRKRFSLAEVMEHPWVLGRTTTSAVVEEETTAHAAAASSPKRRSLRKRLQNARTKVVPPAAYEKRQTIFRPTTQSLARAVDSRC
jgi:serine/threonine protein kinase